MSYNACISMLYASERFQFSGMTLTDCRQPRARFSLIRKYRALRRASGNRGSSITLEIDSSSIRVSLEYWRAMSIRLRLMVFRLNFYVQTYKLICRCMTGERYLSYFSVTLIYLTLTVNRLDSLES
jgi:hypothetical protein